MSFHVIEQLDGTTLRLSSHRTIERAMHRGIELKQASDGQRELFVDGPGMAAPVSVGCFYETREEA